MAWGDMWPWCKSEPWEDQIILEDQRVEESSFFFFSSLGSRSLAVKGSRGNICLVCDRWELIRFHQGCVLTSGSLGRALSFLTSKEGLGMVEERSLAWE